MKEEMKWLFSCLTIMCLGSFVLAYYDVSFMDTAKSVFYALVTGMLAIATGGSKEISK